MWTVGPTREARPGPAHGDRGGARCPLTDGHDLRPDRRPGRTAGGRPSRRALGPVDRGGVDHPTGGRRAGRPVLTSTWSPPTARSPGRPPTVCSPCTDWPPRCTRPPSSGGTCWSKRHGRRRIAVGRRRQRRRSARCSTGTWSNRGRAPPRCSTGLEPDLVVVAGHQHIGAVDRRATATAGRSRWRCSPWASDTASLAFLHFGRVFDRAGSVLAVTESERRRIVDAPRAARRVHRIGAPLAANPSARAEPNPWVGDTGYILVLTDVASEDEVEVNEPARLLRTCGSRSGPWASPTPTRFCVWHRGGVDEGWPIERSSDLGPTAGVRPGDRRSAARAAVRPTVRRVAALRHPDRRPGRQPGRGARPTRAAAGCGSADRASSVWCVEALLDPVHGRP